METFVDEKGNTWVKNNGLSENNEVVFEKATKPKNVLGLVERLNRDIGQFWDDLVRDGLLDHKDLADKNFFTFKAKTIDDKGEWVAINSLHDVNITIAFPTSFALDKRQSIADSLTLWLNGNWNIDLSWGGDNNGVWYFNIDYDFLNKFYDNEVDLQNKL